MSATTFEMVWVESFLWDLKIMNQTPCLLTERIGVVVEYTWIRAKINTKLTNFIK